MLPCAMPDPTPPKPGARRSASEQQARRDREAAALRDNLKRRKEQARARQDAPPDTSPSDTGLPADPDVG